MVGLGETLRDARRQQDITVEQAERDTKIQEKYLTALEREDFTTLPPGAYREGFLRIYSRYLGLDPPSLLALLPKDEEPAVEPLPSLPPPPPELATWLLTALIFIVAALVAWGLYRQGETPISPDNPVLFPLPTPALAPFEARSEATPFPQVPQRSGEAVSSPPPTPARVSPTSTPSRPAFTAAIVPSVIGIPFQDAIKVLESTGLKVMKEEAWSREAPEGAVLNQNPRGGEESPLGTTISLLVSKGPQRVLVPNVAGKPEGEAQKLIISAGLANSPWVNYQGHKDLPKELLTQVCVGCVLSVTPQPGSEVPPGTVINIAVRRE